VEPSQNAPFRSAVGRAKWVAVALVLIVLVDLAIVVLDVQRLDILNRLDTVDADGLSPRLI
jgi:hypothetical protein